MGRTDDELTELALRAAVLCGRESGEPRDINHIEEDAQNYRRQFSNQVGVGNVFSEMASAQTAQEVLIKGAFKSIESLYGRIIEDYNSAQEKNNNLTDEIALDIASFCVPKRGELSNEERCVKAFYELADQTETPWLIPYLGITKKEPTERKGQTYYRVLPFFKVSKDASQSFASPSMLDEVRTEINLFLSVELPEVLQVIEAQFKKNKASGRAVVEYLIQQENYLKNTRLARFFVLALGRLLWALSHQIDLDTAHPSTIKDCFERCSRAQIYINSILNANKPPCLSSITKTDKCLINFIRSTDDLIKDLRHAYAIEQLHELNMEDLTNSVYKSLDILTKGIFTLLYRRHDAGEKKYLPDETAASALKKDLAALTRILKIDDARLEPFRKRAHLVSNVPFFNKKATTLIDVLIIFCHLPHAKRKELIRELKSQINEEGKEVEWATQLGIRLKIFEKRFITPVEYPGEVYKDSSEPFNPHSFFAGPYVFDKGQKRAIVAGQRLIPFLTLLMATRFSHAYALSGEELTRSGSLDSVNLDSNIEMNRNGWQQLQAINDQAKNQNNENNTENDAYFSCRISSFIYASSDINSQLDVLPELHDRMRDLVQLLDLVFKMHKHLSRSQVFYNFFMDCMDWVRNEQTRLGEKIARLKTESSNGVNRYIQEILLPMDLDLIKNFKAIQQAVKDSKRTVTGLKCMDKVEENSAKDIEDIHKLVSRLFNKDSNLLQLISRRNHHLLHSTSFLPSLTSHSLSQSSSEDHRPLQKYALQILMEQSYQSMSYMSRVYSKKGPFLKGLMESLEQKQELTEQDIYDYLEKLIRIASSYRKTSFFPCVEARYGETETMMKTLLPAIQDPKLNKILPFSSIIFEHHQNHVIPDTHEAIIKALNKKCLKEKWERSEDELSETFFLGSPASSPSEQSISRLGLNFLIKTSEGSTHSLTVETGQSDNSVSSTP